MSVSMMHACSRHQKTQSQATNMIRSLLPVTLAFTAMLFMSAAKLVAEQSTMKAYIASLAGPDITEKSSKFKVEAC